MSTSQTTVALLAAAALCGFFFGLSEPRSTAAPVPCAMWDCTDVYAWWVDGNPGGTKCFSAQKPGSKPPFKGTDNLTNALVHGYVPASIGKLPVIQNGTFDRYKWDSTDYQCAQVNGQWPSPQQALPGQGATANFDANVVRSICTQGP
jgi:hypothetical protein